MLANPKTCQQPQHSKDFGAMYGWLKPYDQIRQLSSTSSSYMTILRSEQCLGGFPTKNMWTAQLLRYMILIDRMASV